MRVQVMQLDTLFLNLQNTHEEYITGLDGMDLEIAQQWYKILKMAVEQFDLKQQIAEVEVGKKIYKQGRRDRGVWVV